MINSRWETFLDRLVKSTLFWSPFRSYLLYKYRYAFTPMQLARLTMLATEAAKVDGDFCEIGCYRGYTTVFLNKHLNEIAPGKRYHAIDTFGGFVAKDVAHEKSARGKSSAHDTRALQKFTINSQCWFDRTMSHNGITRVKSHAMPVQDFVAEPGARFCFVMIDVDLYLPTKVAVEKFWPLLSPGGVLVIDDCQEHHVYDGSRQALEEFSKTTSSAFEVVDFKLGILRKPTV